jgi:hypothetical protein
MISRSLKNQLKKWPIDYLSLFLIFLSFYWWWQKKAVIGDPDGFYHAKIAKMIAQGQILQTLPWMQFSTLKDSFTDHHFLYHLLLSFFTHFFDPLWSLKIATAIFATLAVLALYHFFKKLKLNFAWPLSLLILSLPSLNFRWSLIKVNSLSFIVCLVFIYALIKQKKYLLLLSAFIFVWLYGGWPIIFPIYLAWFASIYLLNKLKIQEKIEYQWSNLLWSLGGILFGLVSHPNWPQNLYFYYQQVVQIGIINFGQKFTVGSEWYGAGFLEIMSSAPHLFILAILSMALLVFNYQAITKKTLFTFLLAFGFLLLSIKSKRYAEYLLPFMLIFIAFSCSDLKNILKLQNFYSFWLSLKLNLKIFIASCLIILSISMIYLLFNQINNSSLSNKWPLDKFQASATWLKQNTAAKSIVFHDNWDQWPMLFYHNDHNYYLIGLDQTFMYNFDADLQQEYFDIIEGKINNPDQIIPTKFGAHYIFLEKDNKRDSFKNILLSNENISLVYEDEEAEIYQINQP